MKPEKLKKDFGKDFVFWGGIDVQKFLPFALVNQAKDDVKEIVGTMYENGGYIFGPSHNIQADIPPENIVAMYDIVKNL